MSEWNQNDKRTLLIELRGAFSKITEIDCRECYEAIKAFDVSIGVCAIKTLRAAAGASAWRPDIARLGAIAKRMAMESRENGSTIRINGQNDYLTEQAESRRIAQEQFGNAFDLIGSLSDEQVEAEKQIALTMLGGLMAERKRNADPRTDKLLVGMIADQIAARGGIIE